MVMAQIENFHLALLASEAAPGINDLATLLASAMERRMSRVNDDPLGSSCGTTRNGRS
jgi:hypothetical protein